MSIVLKRLSFRKQCDSHTDMSVSKLVMHKEGELRSREIDFNVISIDMVSETMEIYQLFKRGDVDTLLIIEEVQGQSLEDPYRKKKRRGDRVAGNTKRGLIGRRKNRKNQSLGDQGNGAFRGGVAGQLYQRHQKVLIV